MRRRELLARAAVTAVTAIVNNNGTTTYAIKDANAQSGGVTTEYSGPLPDTGGYTPMHQEGAVILGTGGDNSNGSDSSFFEGVMTAGYPPAATDNAVQANVVAAGYQPVSSVRHPHRPVVLARQRLPGMGLRTRRARRR